MVGAEPPPALRAAAVVHACAVRDLRSPGTTVDYDGLVLATGATPRRPEARAGMAGMHVLLTLEDAVALRDALTAGSRLGVVGAVFLGSEGPTVARYAGLEVTLVDAEPLQCHMPWEARSPAG